MTTFLDLGVVDLQNDLLDMNINFKAKFTKVKELNENFTLVKVYILALGKNRNKTIISKDSVNKAIASLANIPIVGHLYTDEDGVLKMGGHDVALEKNDDGKHILKTLTTALGVVPETHNAHFEDVEEKDGTVSTYLVGDAILWTGRNPELFSAIEDTEIWFNQSMEINVHNISRDKDDKEYTVIDGFTFSALCLLGRYSDDSNVEPCFPSSRIEQYSVDLSQQFEVLKQELAMFFNQNSKKEVEVMNEEYNTDSENFTAEVEPAVNDNPQQEKPFAEDLDGENITTDENPSSEAAGKPEDVEGEENGGSLDGEFSLNHSDKMELFRIALDHMNKSDENKRTSYWICDYDNSFLYVSEDIYNISEDIYESRKCRFTYTLDGKNLALGELEYVFVKWLTLAECDELDRLRSNVAELLEYKQNNENEIKMQKLNSVLNEFADVSETEAFTAIAENLMAYQNEDDLREKLFALRGKLLSFSVSNKESQDKKPKIPVGIGFMKEKEVPHQEFFNRYSKK